MKTRPAIGETHTLSCVVPKRMTVPELIPGDALLSNMPAVLATPNMIALMELACTELLARHTDEGEGSLGAHVDVAHTAATLPGQTVTVTATVEKVEGRKVAFVVEAHDGVDAIGRGRHVRMVVPWARFRQTLDAKAEKAGVAGLGG
ncbi:MAG: thioesterase family protein [Hyphomicrobiaceae bacterium]